jgi:hypothetical protein
MKGGPGKNKYGDPKDGVQYLGKGGKVKKRKGYNHGGSVHHEKSSPVEVAETTAASLRRAGIS